MSISVIELRAVIIAGTLAASASTLGAQLTLDARQGSAWSNEVTVPHLDSLSLRWRWVGLPNVTSARWQVSYTSPASSAQPPLAKNTPTQAPPEKRYQYLRIGAADLPPDVPSTFFIRISGPNRYSNWVTVRVRPGARARAERAQPRNPSSRPTEPERASPGSSAAAVGNLKKDPFIIPGGGAKTGTLTLVDLEKVPLWVRMTQMRCLLRQTEDDDDTDEVYAVVATVRPKSSNLGQSAVSASATKVYTVKRCEKPDAYPRVMFPNIPAWGPEEGVPLSIKVAEGHDNDRDAVIVVAFMERDSDGPPIPLLLELLRGKIRAELSYPVSSSVASSMRKVLNPGFAVTKGDDLISLDVLDISQDDLRRAQMGEVVRLEYTAGRKAYGIGPGKTNELNSGAWIVEFQVGKEGVAVQGIELATCKDGTKWYGWSLIGVCAGRGGIADTHLHNWALLKPQ